MDKTKCSSCDCFHLNHEDLPPVWRTGEHGLCLSPFRPRHAAHKDSTRCLYWTEREEPKAGNPGIEEMSPDQLYDFKDHLKRQRVTGQSQYAAHTRQYKREMLKKVNGELRRRGLPVTRPDDPRVYGPGQARFQRAAGAG